MIIPDRKLGFSGVMEPAYRPHLNRGGLELEPGLPAWELQAVTCLPLTLQGQTSAQTTGCPGTVPWCPPDLSAVPIIQVRKQRPRGMS